MAYNQPNTAPYGVAEPPREHGGILGRIEDKLEQRRERKEFERETGMHVQGGAVPMQQGGAIPMQQGGHHHHHHHQAGYGGMTAQGYTPASNVEPVTYVGDRGMDGGVYGGHNNPAVTSTGYTTNQASNIDPVTGQPRPGIGQRIENAIRDGAKTKGIADTVRVMADDLKGRGPNGGLAATGVTTHPAPGATYAPGTGAGANYPNANYPNANYPNRY